jgi:hypothetical protein
MHKITKNSWLLSVMILINIAYNGCKQKTAEEESSIYYIYMFEPQEYPEYRIKYTEKDILGILFPLPDEGTEYYDTALVGDFQIIDLIGKDVEPEYDSTIIVMAKVIRINKGIENEYIDQFFMKEGPTGLEIVSHQSMTRDEYLQTLVPEGEDRTMDEDALSPADDEIYFLPNLELNRESNFYNLISEEALFNAIFVPDISYEYMDTNYVMDMEIMPCRMIAADEEANISFIDSTLIVLAKCTGELTDYYEYEHVDDYCLVAVKVLPDSLKVIARDWHPVFENFMAEGGGGKEAYIELNLFQIHPDAQAAGLTFKHAEGNEFEENSRAEMELYIIENQMFASALYAELEQYSYSYSYGEEESSSSSEMWTDITLSDELNNGFYNLILTHHYRESENNELIRDDEQTDVYQWVGTGYSKGD